MAAFLGVSIEPENLNQLLKELGAIEFRASDLRPTGLGVRLIMQSDVDERFDSSPGTEETGEVYGGVVWERLTETYLSSNPRRRGGQQLRDTGELLQSFTAAGEGIFEIDKDEFVFGSALPKARYLNAKRPMLFFHEDLADTITNYLQQYIISGKT